MDINGENLNNISGSLTKCSHPSISPDNSYIAFECITDGQEELYIVSPDGTDLNQLTNTAGNDRDPVFMYQIH
jgi:Tol biopolymer transport system component